MADEEEKKGRDLSDEEKVEQRQGHELYEMTQTAGWKVIKKWLEDRAYHSWIDPREVGEKDWIWRELNLFHSADVAKQVMEEIARAISRSDYLTKVESGEMDEAKKFKI